MAPSRSAVLAVLGSLGVGAVITLASGESRADRDVAYELTRANEALSERLEQQELELAELRDTVAALAGKPGPSNPTTKQPTDNPGTKGEAELKDALEFRKKVLAVMEKDLAEIDASLATKASKEAFDKHVTAYSKHRHDYEKSTHGWVRLDHVLTHDALDMVRPTYADDMFATIRFNDGQPSNSGTVTLSTTAPK